MQATCDNIRVKHFLLNSQPYAKDPMRIQLVDISRIDDYQDIIDVRSPSEFDADHIPGARNLPVLNDKERAQVGTLYNTNAFEARKLGAALISRNIAHFLQTELAPKDKSWCPLLYCWRGGMRSTAAATVLAHVGWQVGQLQGGYKTYRHAVLNTLETSPQQFQYIVVCGPTGSGKSRLLHALQKNGQQVLDLEALAIHRGSILGLVPGQTQPTQRFFETLLKQQLGQFTPEKPVFIEAESRRIGAITLPKALYQSMHQGYCLTIEVPLAERVRFLCEDYDFYLKDPSLLQDKLTALAVYHPREELEHWHNLIGKGQFQQLVETLLSKHYDPHYWRSLHQHYPQAEKGHRLKLKNLDSQQLEEAIRKFDAYFDLNNAVKIG